MKTSTKIWIIAFVISLVGSILLMKQINSGINFGRTIYFDFSVWGYIGLGFVGINTLCGNVLFFKFLKTQSFNRMLFFSTVPLTISSVAICFYIYNVGNRNTNDAEYFRELLNIAPTNNNAYLWLILIALLYFAILFITFRIACKPLLKVEKAVSRLGNGRVLNEILIGGNKQFKDIEHSLNKINDNYKEKENILKKTNSEYEKYIPKQFLKFLGKNSILELQLGNQVQREVTTMFVDIRNSTKISTTLSLEENFNYINSYLNLVGPLIRKYGGFVDKYLGDGILAVFVKPERALECATAITKVIENKNISQTKMPNLDVYISINTGEVAFGIVGEEERKSPTIISDAVNLVSKMEEFNKYFGSKIIFSKRTLNSLKIDYPLSYRYVGSLTFGDKEYISLFESLECYSKKTRERMEDNKTQFEQAVRYFNLGKCFQAKELFTKILKNVREDKVAYMYFNKAEQNTCGEAPLRL